MNKIKECIGIIYFTVCLVNGMGYVGFHHTSADDGYFGSGLILNRSIKKYGKDKFRRIIIEHYSTKKERKTCIPIEIDGIQYQSIRGASRILNIPRGTINDRLKSKNFPNYKYIKEI